MKKYKKKLGKVEKEHVISKPQEIPLSDTDRITYIFKYVKRGNKSIKIIEVANVSYEIFTNRQWVTIVRYDSAHGYLHKHVRISLENDSDTTTTAGVKKKGDQKIWLAWAIRDFRNRFVYYKSEFMRRSKF